MQRGADDRVRLLANAEFQSRLTAFLSTDSSTGQCPRFSQNLSCVCADNVRVLTWTVPSYEGDKYSYFGFVQLRDPKTGATSLHTLSDSTEVIRKPESEKLNASRWFGAAYYEIIPKKKAGRKYYTLIGWKGKDRRVTQKVLEVLYFENGMPRFGAPIFKKESVFRSRVVFSFTSQATMSLRYEPAKRMIVYDHLSGPKVPGSGSSDPALSGPDGSYDGYRFRGGRWQWFGDLNMRSPRSPR
jgi:hypothetical protein